jgi:hypothetical protein
MNALRKMRLRHVLLGACVAGAGGLALAGTALSSRQAGPAGLIVFQKEGPKYGDGQLFTIRPDGTGLRQITHGPTSSVNADWSPDGTTLAFSHYLPDSALVSLMNADGSNVRAVTPEGFQDAPSFTPDGKALVYTRDPSPSEDGLWIIATDGTSPRRLTANPFIHNGECGCDGAAKVSPDGKTVAFVRVKRDNVTHALFSIGIERTGLKPLLPYTLVVGNHLDWSPDGKRIAVTIGVNLAPGKSANVATVGPGRQEPALGDPLQGRSDECLRRRVLTRRQVARDPHRPGCDARVVPRPPGRDCVAPRLRLARPRTGDRLGKGDVMRGISIAFAGLVVAESEGESGGGTQGFPLLDHDFQSYLTSSGGAGTMDLTGLEPATSWGNEGATQATEIGRNPKLLKQSKPRFRRPHRDRAELGAVSFNPKVAGSILRAHSPPHGCAEQHGYAMQHVRTMPVSDGFGLPTLQ